MPSVSVVLRGMMVLEQEHQMQEVEQVLLSSMVERRVERKSVQVEYL